MKAAKRILVLDDDPHHLSQIATKLDDWGYIPQPCEEIGSASLAVAAGIDFAIIDLFLSGNDGDELSNGFILHEIIPNNIRYIRMTSAPGLVPQEFSGLGVYDKRQYRLNANEFKAFLAQFI